VSSLVAQLAIQNDMLCDLCQKREATVHTTHCTNIADDVPKQSHLCDECLESSNPAQVGELRNAFEAGCRYCGGRSDSGGFDPVAMLRGIREMSFTCRPCAEEYFRFLRQTLPGFGEATITTEQIAVIRTHNMAAVLMEADEHMKKWVADRGS